MRTHIEWNVDTHIARARGADERGHPLLHLAGGLVGEGDREDLAGLHVPGAEQVGDAVGEHPRLARAGTGHDEQRAALVDDGLTLRAVEPGEHAVELAPDLTLRGALEGLGRELAGHRGGPAARCS